MKKLSYFIGVAMGVAFLASPVKAEAVTVPNAPKMQPMSQADAQTRCTQEVPKFCAEPKNAARCADQKKLTDECIAAMTDHNMLDPERREAIWQLNKKE